MSVFIGGCWDGVGFGGVEEGDVRGRDGEIVSLLLGGCHEGDRKVWVVRDSREDGNAEMEVAGGSG
jgi:hypothetical protein